MDLTMVRNSSGDEIEVGDTVEMRFAQGPLLRGVVHTLATEPFGIVGVSWEGFTKGGSLGGILPDNSGWFTHPDDLRVVDKPSRWEWKL